MDRLRGAPGDHAVSLHLPRAAEADTADYTLRDGGARFSVRHRSGDIDIFRKFYAYRYYEWPTAVKAQLRELGRPVNVVDLGSNIGFFQVHTRTQIRVGDVVLRARSGQLGCPGARARHQRR